MGGLASKPPKLQNAIQVPEEIVGRTSPRHSPNPNSNAALFSSASDKSAEETARETFLNLISRFAPAARTPIPLQPAPQPSSRHVKAPSLKRGRAQSTRVVSMPLVRRRSLEFPRSDPRGCRVAHRGHPALSSSPIKPNPRRFYALIYRIVRRSDHQSSAKFQ